MGLRTKIKNIIKKYFWTSKEQKKKRKASEKQKTSEKPKTSDTRDMESFMVQQSQNSKEIVSKPMNHFMEPIIVEEGNVGSLQNLQDTQSSKQDSAIEDSQKEKNEKEDKLSRHRRKARLGLLRFVLQNERCVDLASLHKYSEMRYLIGHKAFSDLMEEMVEDGVLHFDWDENTAHLTEKGFLEIEIEK